MGDHGMLLLSWNSHHATFCDILSRLRGKASFTDVTLACEGKFYPLHKLVLSTCSEYLEKIFESTPCKHPVIVLQDIKCSELEALINYMYVGEVNVPQSSLTSLIKAAELLQVKGLAVPDTPPSTSKKKLGAHEVSDDRVSPQAKRRKCEENTSSTGQKGRPPASNNSSPDTALHLKERRQTPVLESSRTHSSGSHQVSEQQQQHQSSEEPSLGHIEDVFVETDIKEELVEDLDDGNNLNASVPALDYQNQSSSYKAEDAGPDSEGDCGFSLPSDYNKQQPLEHQNILSHSTNVPDLPVNSSEIQGWMTEGRLDGELSVVEGYSGAGILDTSSPMITQQHGAPLHEQQMVLDVGGERTDEKGPWGPMEMPSTVKKNFECPICYQTFTTSSPLLVHVRKHTKKPFLCPHCPKGFLYNSILKVHIRTHTGEKPYACPLCSYRSTQIGALNTHMRTHSRHQQYSCSDCSYKSAKFSSLKRHIAEHQK
ncbi:zinc finger and SCAN domain-containing protein 2-like isoform X3 [Homarus americanus]|uniref:zinc finger and SCAN domain-containing protein 2-like isoform X3 n=1 Tax=Homarus americanus TaxID=6706 RepID=UPI001C4834AA|nr:zinc finger and SCAN domain-containing protein 2-like isoform X3 [Homarus americanus]